MDRILPMVDQEISNMLKRNLQKAGVEIINEARVKSINNNTVNYELNGKENFVTSEYTLLAVGRTPNTENLNLESVGIELEGKSIKVDEYLRTNVENIYAIGDVNGKVMLAHTASHEGMVALDNIFKNFREMEYDKIPSCIYVNPEIASIGLTEEQAREKYENIKVGKFPVIGNGKALVEGNTEGLIKVILDAELDEVVGVHIMSIHATNMIAEIAVAMNLESTSEEIMNSIHPHPTVAEMIPEAFMAANGRSIHF
jgi:dihydrolipoamide dehydrogenase